MPNTNKKKFDFSILLASLSIVLVICCAVVCCVIGIGSDNQVAQAYIDEEIGVSNLSFTIDEGFFYVRDLLIDPSTLRNLIVYFGYFIPNLTELDSEYTYYFECGTLNMYLEYIDESISGNCVFDFVCELYKTSDSSIIHFSIILREIYILNEMYLIEFAYDLQNLSTDDQCVAFGEIEDNVYIINPFGHPSSTNFVGALLDLAEIDHQLIYGVSEYNFIFSPSCNCGILISDGTGFADPPIIIPEDMYYDYLDDAYSNGYDDGFDSGYDLGIEDGSAGSYAQGYKDALESFKSINLTSNINYFNRYSYQYLDGNLWRQADTDQIKSSVWLNNAPSEYLFTSNYFNLSGLNQFLVPLTEYKNFTLFASERHVGDSTLSITLAVESLDESFSISFYDGDRLTYNLELSTTYQNGVPVSYGTLPIGYPFTHIVLNYIDDNALFTLDAINQIVITANNFVVDSYNTALDQGYKNGYEQGYNVARDKYINNDYSFFALFSGVLDAPLQVIIGTEEKPGMLNFYIPGLDINIAPFLLSLFTVALVITVIRFILARAS